MRSADLIFKSLFLEMEKVFVREGGREREFHTKLSILKKKILENRYGNEERE